MTTLYVTEPRSLVKKDDQTLLIEIPEDKDKGTPKRSVRVPLIKVDQVVICGDSTVTSPALAALLEQRVEVCFLSQWGQFRGRLAPAFSKNSLVRLAQHRAHEDARRSLQLARQFVAGKLHNCRTLLLRSNRKLEDPALAEAAASLKGVTAQAEVLESDGAPPSDPGKPQAGTAWGTLHGLEGAGSARYFGVFDRLLREPMGFDGRNRRPPRDPVNAILSYGYVLLMHQCSAAAQLVGLDPYVGFLHSSQYGKPALALDLMEEFRPLVVDSVVLTLVNNRIVQIDDFVEEMGAWRLKDAARRTFLVKFEERLNTEITHPVMGYKATYRRCLELQARLLGKVLMGEVAEYKPLVVR
ncbi:MAG: type I-D CRISPR-associated endonuclease Cas1 [Thermoflexales bacterium]|nr:type I-D CRISPR-associated endonuclease Cas1 [Thermoflexales bacterium]